jgi:hypothetical protein
VPDTGSIPVGGVSNELLVGEMKKFCMHISSHIFPANSRKVLKWVFEHYLA